MCIFNMQLIIFSLLISLNTFGVCVKQSDVDQDVSIQDLLKGAKSSIVRNESFQDQLFKSRNIAKEYDNPNFYQAFMAQSLISSAKNLFHEFNNNLASKDKTIAHGITKRNARPKIKHVSSSSHQRHRKRESNKNVIYCSATSNNEVICSHNKYKYKLKLPDGNINKAVVNKIITSIYSSIEDPEYSSSKEGDVEIEVSRDLGPKQVFHQDSAEPREKLNSCLIAKFTATTEVPLSDKHLLRFKFPIDITAINSGQMNEVYENSGVAHKNGVPEEDDYLEKTRSDSPRVVSDNKPLGKIEIGLNRNLKAVDIDKSGRYISLSNGDVIDLPKVLHLVKDMLPPGSNISDAHIRLIPVIENEPFKSLHPNKELNLVRVKRSVGPNVDAESFPMSSTTQEDFLGSPTPDTDSATKIPDYNNRDAQSSLKNSDNEMDETPSLNSLVKCEECSKKHNCSCPRNCACGCINYLST